MRFFSGVLLTHYFVLGIACVGVPTKEVQLPPLPFFEGAQWHASLRDPEIIKTILKAKKILDKSIYESIQSIAISGFDSSTVFVVRAARANGRLKYRVLKSLGGVALDEDRRYWDITIDNTIYGVDIGYEDTFIVSENKDVDWIQELRFITELPTSATTLGVRDGDAFWLWGEGAIFREYFSTETIGDGNGALRIPTYGKNLDVNVSIALPYYGKKSDIATFKLALPFLFKSIRANILGSLPEIRFVDDLVTVNGLFLPRETIALFFNVFGTGKNNGEGENNRPSDEEEE